MKSARLTTKATMIPTITAGAAWELEPTKPAAVVETTDSVPRIASIAEPAQSRGEEVGAVLEGHVPDAVERVLGGAGDAHAGEQRADDADRQTPRRCR